MVNTHKIILSALVSYSLCIGNIFATTPRTSENNFDQMQKSKALKIQTKEQFNPDECFDKIWGIIRDEFWDPNFNGVDWQNIREQYMPKALVANNHESFAIIINQMLAELKTSHTHYYTKWEPDYYTLQAVLISQSLAALNISDISLLTKYVPGRYSSEGHPHRTGIGIVTKEIDGCHYVTAVLTSSPVKELGILLGDWFIEVNGRPFHPIRSFQNKAGQEIEVTVQSGPSESTRHVVKVVPVDKDESKLFENDSYTRTKIIEYKDHRFVYMPLWWLSGLKMKAVLDKGLKLASRSKGIIIDLRSGFGGSPAVDYIRPFLKNGLETISIESIGRDHISKSTAAGFNKPIIVLINSGSRSGKELLAYYFKKTQRGVLVGERTAGYVTAGKYQRISQDSILYYCVQMIVVDSKRLEGVGIEPDIEVPFDIRFAAGKDIQLERAKDEMINLIEAITDSSDLRPQFRNDSVISLGLLQTRDRIIRLEGGGKLSIFDLSGNPIAISLSSSEFQKVFPRLHKDLKTAIANIESGDIMLDASIGTGHY